MIDYEYNNIIYNIKLSADKPNITNQFEEIIILTCYMYRENNSQNVNIMSPPIGTPKKEQRLNV